MLEDPTLNGTWDGLYVEYGHTWWGKGFDGYNKEELEKLPRVTTETGWNTRVRQGGNSTAITEEEQGKLFLNLYLDACKRGWTYTFIYMLRDSPGQGAWGLVHNDYSPKPSATFLHNLTTILADKPADFSPAKLDFTIPAEPAAVHHLLMQKSDGAFALAIWAEQAKGSSDITVNFAAKHPSIKIYDPTIGADPIQSLTNVAAVPLTLSDHPLIVKIDAESR